MKNKVYFAMGLHFHQPVGNLEEILERAFQNCYKPFLETFTKYPSIKMTFHFSGNLLDYFEERHPEFLNMVKTLVDRGQAEIMGGGYYEPIFQTIPQQDRIGQIEMLSDYCEEKFGIRPKGIWTAERVWSPELIEVFRRCGMRYSILDDIHLIKAGVSPEELLGYFMTGEGDNKIAIFPSNKKLRYIIPFKAPRETMDCFKKAARKRKDTLFTYGDDAEKFGEWPWTHDWVYKKGWLDNFFRELERNQDWITTITFSEYLNLNPALKEVEIPETSYEEMLEWSGGSWMNFLKKYPESDQMHKRMTYTSEKISELEHKSISAKGHKEKLEEATRELYKGQCNCAYWHGVFGGIYLGYLRSAVYEHLIKADRILDEIETRDKANIREIDFYKNGKKAVIMEDKNFFICIDPGKGGIIKELDYKPRSANVTNALARRRESYHKKIMDRIQNRVSEPVSIHEAIKTMDKRIKGRIVYDKYDRWCLIDHFMDKDLKKEDFENCDYVERGNFADKPYSVSIKENRVILQRGCITKEIKILSDEVIEIVYTLEGGRSAPKDTMFGVEFNTSLPAKLYFDIEPTRLWEFPVMTVSQSERAYDLNYQSSCIFPMWNINLASGEDRTLNIKWLMS